MFESLSDKLEHALKKLSGQAKINEINIGMAMRDIKRALLDADVNYKVTKNFVEQVRKQALGEEVIKSVSPAQMIVKIVHDELVKAMGGEQKDINLKTSRMPAVIMVAGLQGSGKTTFTAKLANLLKKKGRAPLLIAADVYRPAAIEQLKTLGAQIGVPVFSIEEKDALKAAKQGIEFAKQNSKNVAIVDTAGRLQIDEEMMAEAERLKRELSPEEILFVVDSMIGQEAVNTAKVFNDRLDFDGVVLTKMDGDTRGGAALSIKTVVDKPIKFLSQGEKVDDLDIFYPERMAQRILGMGDIVSFVEKAQETLDLEKTQKLQKRLIENEFNLEDFYEQLQELKKMGSLQNLIDMIPGLSKVVPKQEIDESNLKVIEAIINSMTKDERQKPGIINGSRRSRIAKGSGTRVQDVNMLLKQFMEMKKMMKSVTKMAKSGRKITAQNIPFNRLMQP
ncbi:signal recognition particle protein [Chloroherpeton thalassium ATCC 35110]|uniref:Signal recognition particle protein n=1 Tax=Chloroherpeton thalassium (strain ATCC 35110 / GB-78) TaxID=517418 RepID=B3QXJ9_CHLT3|nr:signal recognition particle protein [Chloroherpeton thalassium]ACF14914.1 signal recognition particle protein [Chloroherpeton thalassium ATCC 35110]